MHNTVTDTDKHRQKERRRNDGVVFIGWGDATVILYATYLPAEGELNRRGREDISQVGAKVKREDSESDPVMKMHHSDMSHSFFSHFWVSLSDVCGEAHTCRWKWKWKLGKQVIISIILKRKASKCSLLTLFFIKKTASPSLSRWLWAITTWRWQSPLC